MAVGSVAVSALSAFLLAFAVASNAPHNSLMQTSQARQFTSLDTEDWESGPANADANDTETKQDAASEISRLLGQMEAMMDFEPGKGGQLKDTLEGIMTKFNTVSMDTFKKAMNETQQKIENNVRDLENAFNATMSAKKAADQQNVLLAKCRGDEREKLEAVESCIDENMWMNRTRDEACKAMDDAKFVKWKIDKELTAHHKCDVSDISCPKLDELKQQVREYTTFLEAKRTDYLNKHAECNKTREESIAQAETCMNLRDDFLQKKSRCDGEAVNTQVAMCAFGHRLQEQCSQLSATNEFNHEVRTGTGTPYSEPDREENFEKIQVMKCSLQSYTSGGEVTEEVRQTCATKVNYKADVGVMDYKADRILKLLSPSPPSFTCKETDVDFEGPTWEVGNITAKYVQQEKTNLLFNSTHLATPPFEFCASNHSRARCRGFKCPKNWEPKTDSLESTCELRTCSRHECCSFANKTSLFSMPRAHKFHEPLAVMPARDTVAPHVLPQTPAKTSAMAIGNHEVSKALTEVGAVRTNPADTAAFGTAPAVVSAAVRASESVAPRARAVSFAVGDISAKGSRRDEMVRAKAFGPRRAAATHAGKARATTASRRALGGTGANSGLAGELANLRRMLKDAAERHA